MQTVIITAIHAWHSFIIVSFRFLLRPSGLVWALCKQGTYGLCLFPEAIPVLASKQPLPGFPCNFISPCFFGLTAEGINLRLKPRHDDFFDICGNHHACGHFDQDSSVVVGHVSPQVKSSEVESAP